MLGMGAERTDKGPRPRLPAVLTGRAQAVDRRSVRLQYPRHVLAADPDGGRPLASGVPEQSASDSSAVQLPDGNRVSHRDGFCLPAAVGKAYTATRSTGAVPSVSRACNRVPTGRICP